MIYMPLPESARSILGQNVQSEVRSSNSVTVPLAAGPVNGMPRLTTWSPDTVV